jgi:hypothetical protein
MRGGPTRAFESGWGSGHETQFGDLSLGIFDNLDLDYKSPFDLMKIIRSSRACLGAGNWEGRNIVHHEEKYP